MKVRITRRDVVIAGSAAAASCALGRKGAVESTPPFDMVIRGGRILDGTGGPEWTADLGLSGDTIAAIGTIDPEQARRAIDATGLCVAPGFIDIHTHSDRSVLVYPGAESRVFQGITTEVTGNCGGSAAPRCGKLLEKKPREDGEDEDPSARPTWTDVASYFRTLSETRIAVNHALLLGQGTLRESVIGLENRPLSPVELGAVLRLVEEGLEQGAIGLSTGLEYVPGRFTPTEEIIAMARVVARRGRLYASHIRNEEAGLLEAIDEAIRIGRESGARVEVSHLKAAGKPNWGKQEAAIARIEDARKGGIEVLADAYPYTAYSTGLTIFLEDWAREGGNDAILERLRDAETRRRIRDALPARIASDPGDGSLIVIASVGAGRNKDAIGKSVSEIAAAWKLEPEDALLRLLEEENASVSFIGHGMSEENVARVLAHPLVMIGSDGSCMAPRGIALQSRPHPRSYGTCARVLARYVRERKLLDLPTAVKKMTSMPAEQLGLRDRGLIGRGMKADLVVFDAEKVRDEATFEEPHKPASGILHVLVNGAPVVAAGRSTDARPGRVLA